MTRVTTRYEYKVVPAPRRGEKARGAKQTEDRFAHALASLMNRMGRDGWDYLRAETLPCEERSGLTGRTTTFQNMLVFRRVIEDEGRAAPSFDPMDDTQAPDIPAGNRMPSVISAPRPEASRTEPHRTEPNRTETPRAEGPRLVSSREDEGGKAPAVGPARGESPAD
ncbi:DUF4177 domain-containing protein [Acidimangrovimonas sediminis]|uniref:DUF4177 domain-containing protein n=1 Tax=Acidimangrovimonas sediminis TaxID=2056283 RepID=UPI001E4D210D|nr:DUF4177 domain-containing protein [Acidimangrovimonas sediminis]